MDYAEAAAREWFADVQAQFGVFAKQRHRDAFEDSVQRLVVVIRNHVHDNIDDINKSLMQ
jgi:hypothetical protein